MFAFDGGNHNEPPGACVAAWVSEGSALLCQVWWELRATLVASGALQGAGMFALYWSAVVPIQGMSVWTRLAEGIAPY